MFRIRVFGNVAAITLAVLAGAIVKNIAWADAQGEAGTQKPDIIQVDNLIVRTSAPVKADTQIKPKEKKLIKVERYIHRDKDGKAIPGMDASAQQRITPNQPQGFADKQNGD